VRNAVFNKIENLPPSVQEKFTLKSRTDGVKIDGTIRLSYEGDREKCIVNVPIGRIGNEYKMIA
jgi:hypothetical protein